MYAAVDEYVDAAKAKAAEPEPAPVAKPIRPESAAAGGLATLCAFIGAKVPPEHGNYLEDALRDFLTHEQRLTIYERMQLAHWAGSEVEELVSTVRELLRRVAHGAFDLAAEIALFALLDRIATAGNVASIAGDIVESGDEDAQELAGRLYECTFDLAAESESAEDVPA